MGQISIPLSLYLEKGRFFKYNHLVEQGRNASIPAHDNACKTRSNRRKTC